MILATTYSYHCWYFGYCHFMMTNLSQQESQVKLDQWDPLAEMEKTVHMNHRYVIV